MAKYKSPKKNRLRRGTVKAARASAKARKRKS